MLLVLVISPTKTPPSHLVLPLYSYISFLQTLT